MPDKREDAVMAIMYDFDKTLSTDDMQNYAFIPNLGLKPEEFWGMTSSFTESEGVERILSYMYVMLAKAKEKGISVTREYLASCGKNIAFYRGVQGWFDRINAYAASKGVRIEHYLVSSGTIEIVEGCSIYKNFEKAYGCEYYYDPVTKEAVWPKLAINYTQKTQFFFRIAKGVKDISDDNSVNQKTPKLSIPYRNIVYVGDGMTDIPCMTLVKQNGGNSIAVYNSKNGDAEKVKQIRKDRRCDWCVKADYSAGSDMETVMKLIIDSIAIQSDMEFRQDVLDNK